MIILLLLLLSISIHSYQPVSQLDLNNYIGIWYQVYGDNFDKLFENGKCIKAEYEIINSNNVSILNTQIKNNQPENITGFAYYKDGNSGGELTVKLDGQNEAPYWVIKLGPIVNNYYDYSIVSDNIKLSLFVLARDINNFFELYNTEVIDYLDQNGFTKMTNKPVITDQEDC